jgi:hypothetical protein
MATADAEGERRFAPYLRLYLEGNRLANRKAREQIDQLREIGVRIFLEDSGE